MFIYHFLFYDVSEIFKNLFQKGCFNKCFSRKNAKK